MKLMQFIGIFFLLITSLSALPAGYSMIVDPSGKDMGIPLSYLEDSPFNSFLIPGIVLFTVIGLFGLLVLYFTIRKMKHYENLLMLYGVCLTGWIVIQMMMVQYIHYFHFIIGFIGLFLIFYGWLIGSKTTTSRKAVVAS